MENVKSDFNCVLSCSIKFFNFFSINYSCAAMISIKNLFPHSSHDISFQAQIFCAADTHGFETKHASQNQIVKICPIG